MVMAMLKVSRRVMSQGADARGANACEVFTSVEFESSPPALQGADTVRFSVRIVICAKNLFL